MAVALSTLRERVRQRADIENSTDFIPDSEVDTYINSSYKELHGLLLLHQMLRTETNQTITADGSFSYTLPADYFATVGVFEQIDNTFRPVRHSTNQSRPFGLAAESADAYEYRTANDEIELYPAPSGGTYIHNYVPLLTELSLDADTLDGVNGWEEFIVIDAAIKCMHKEESDARHLQIEREQLRERIRMEAEARQLGATHTVQDSRSVRYTDPADIWPYRGNHDY